MDTLKRYTNIQKGHEKGLNIYDLRNTYKNHDELVLDISRIFMK